MYIDKQEVIGEGVAPKVSRHHNDGLVFVYLGTYRRGTRLRVLYREVVGSELAMSDEWWITTTTAKVLLEA